MSAERRRYLAIALLPLLAGACQSVLGPTEIEGEWQAYTSAHFSLHVRPGTFAEQSIPTITEWLEDQYAVSNARLALTYSGRVTGLLYPAAEDAGARPTGAAPAIPRPSRSRRCARRRWMVVCCICSPTRPIT